jgi:hypothetical protein
LISAKELSKKTVFSSGDSERVVGGKKARHHLFSVGDIEPGQPALAAIGIDHKGWR